ncbi:hypothetical protein SAMN02745751_03129 [Dethiosulfatibacter aminovorans DSM 17477]|uniref:Uncharacterized protein n=1 Tax=Dethiosulfatibacter aminovorans DSM 17477 TaxID=1121476 RepID=A0A1M6LBI4_9FIRM|nr:hypothetical protein [Dethiosulfatibacter aminovorans]SHJ68597.1 hypothetical protein SAMN02745751_03129 [Dethiosulfatibacter aminovorans DSM 17477]
MQDSSKNKILEESLSDNTRESLKNLYKDIFVDELFKEIGKKFEGEFEKNKKLSEDSRKAITSRLKRTEEEINKKFKEVDEFLDNSYKINEKTYANVKSMVEEINILKNGIESIGQKNMEISKRWNKKWLLILSVLILDFVALVLILLKIWGII